MTQTIDLSKESVGHEKAINLIDDLNYACYRHNRRISPNVLPHYFDFVYGTERIERYEARFQAELVSRG